MTERMIFTFELMHTKEQPQLLNSNDNMNWHKAAKIKKILRNLGAREAWVYLANHEPTEPFSPSKSKCAGEGIQSHKTQIRPLKLMADC